MKLGNDDCKPVPVSEAADYLGISIGYLRYLMKAKKIDVGTVIPGKRNKYLIYRSKLVAFKEGAAREQL